MVPVVPDLPLPRLFVEEMKFDEASGWPYVDFGSKAAASYEFAAAE